MIMITKKYTLITTYLFAGPYASFWRNFTSI